MISRLRTQESYYLTRSWEISQDCTIIWGCCITRSVRKVFSRNIRKDVFWGKQMICLSTLCNLRLQQPYIVLLCRVEKQAGGGGRALMLVSGKKGSARHIRDGSWEGDCALHICTNSLFTHSPCCHPSLGEHLHICTFAQPLFSPCCHPHVLCLCSAHLRHLSSHLVTLLEQWQWQWIVLLQLNTHLGF